MNLFCSDSRFNASPLVIIRNKKSHFSERRSRSQEELVSFEFSTILPRLDRLRLMQLKAFDIKTPLLSLVRSACPPKSSSGKNTCHAIVCSGWTFHNSAFFLYGHPGIFRHYLVKINFHNFLQCEKGLTMSLFQLRTYKQIYFESSYNQPTA